MYIKRSLAIVGATAAEDVEEFVKLAKNFQFVAGSIGHIRNKLTSCSRAGSRKLLSSSRRSRT